MTFLAAAGDSSLHAARIESSMGRAGPPPAPRSHPRDSNGETVWEGEVPVFALMGHPEAITCYAWEVRRPGDGRARGAAGQDSRGRGQGVDYCGRRLTCSQRNNHSRARRLEPSPHAAPSHRDARRPDPGDLRVRAWGSVDRYRRDEWASPRCGWRNDPRGARSAHQADSRGCAGHDVTEAAEGARRLWRTHATMDRSMCP
jgi:hypothetical protein